MVLKRLFGRAGKAAPVYALAPGKRVYAVGDIHGRLDLLNALLIKIDAERAKAPGLDHHLVLLGDYVDRGPESAGVIDRIMGLCQSEPHLTVLKGNHEDLMLRAIDGDRSQLKLWARNGGRETLLSYGMDAQAYDDADFDELEAMLTGCIPAAHLEFMRGLTISRALDGYLFVHAGIHPDAPLDQQSPADMMWIRGRFLENDDDHGAMIVHGHCITDDVDIRHNRIGVDTGAYATNRLSAIVLERAERRVLDASF
jgi:serine/threonine protein phosphatase 1